MRRSKIQHGPLNKRIYLMKLHNRDLPGIMDDLDRLALEKGYTKIFAKVPSGDAKAFYAAGYVREAFVPYFFEGSKDAFFLSKFFSEKRATEQYPKKIQKILSTASKKPSDAFRSRPPFTFTVEECRLEDCVEISRLYRKVFKTYPFPIQNPAFIKDSMQKHVQYFRIRDKKVTAALASCEMDFENRNVEMTDFATAAEYRRKGLGSILLNKMEKKMRDQGFRTAYSIARSTSYGINITFARNGYQHAGTLVNNTNICGSFESMNVWFKQL